MPTQNGGGEPDTKRSRNEGHKEARGSMQLPSEARQPDQYESAHVHQVYDAIAEHFSGTRFRAWPRILEFLHSLPPYTMIADVGCGNGKYFPSAQQHLASSGSGEDGEGANTVPAHRYVVGLDYSEALLRQTQRSLADPNYAPETTHVTQRTAPEATVKEKVKTNRRKRQMICDPSSEAKEVLPFPRTDVLRSDARQCPMRGGVFDAAISVAVIHHYATHERRVQAAQELLRLVRADGGRVLVYVWALVESHKRRAGNVVDEGTGDGLVRWQMNQLFDEEGRVYHRYYHFFREGELERLFEEAAATATSPLAYNTVASYFDKENWCLVLERCASK